MPVSPIAAHYARLKQAGLDLGALQGAEQDAGYGGRVQVYAGGRIYWHQSTGAHAVRGRHLERYLQTGGHDINPASGVRELGFPTTDHQGTEDGQYEEVLFEWGTISAVAGTALVRIFGPLYAHWRTTGGELGPLGHPIDDVRVADDGQAAWFERGLLWRSPEGQIVAGQLEPALPGRPALVDPSQPVRLDWLAFSGAIAVFDTRAGLMAALTTRRYGLHPVGGGDVVPLTVALEAGTEGGRRRATLTAGGARGRFPALRDVANVPGRGANAPKVVDRQLYSLAFLTSGLAPRAISPHCLYARAGWDSFGIAHITDLHVSRRIEYYRQALRDAGVPESEIALLNNYNDDFRAFICYANHLHARGLLDVVIATGDLVDYVREANDHPEGAGNFGFFEALMQGQAHSPDRDSPPAEALRVPLFTCLGNHDYRQLPYPLGWVLKAKTSDLLGDIPLVGDALKSIADGFSSALGQVPGLGMLNRLDIVELITGFAGVMWNHVGHNTTHDEALKLMGLTSNGTQYFVPAMRPATAAKSITVEPTMKDRSHYYFRRINRDNSYVIPLGANRVVMLDTRWDAEIPGKFTEAVAAKYGFGSESKVNFAQGHPDTIGVTPADVTMLKQAITEVDGKGVVIVGMHAPPLNPVGADMANCLRETAHPTTDPVQVNGWLARHAGDMVVATAIPPKPVPGADRKHPGWIRSGTPHFHEGAIEDMLDEGTAIGHQEELARLFAGSAGRPVTLVCSGHGHYRMEFRLRWDPSKKKLLTFTDHYLGNPEMYYRCSVVEKPEWWLSPSTRVYRVRLQDGARPEGDVAHISDQRDGAVWKDLSELRVAPYATPLSKATDPAAWWQAHAPVVTQTAALGPCDNTRENTDINPNAPGPNCQGFRVMQVKDNVIQRVEYIATQDVLRGSFPLAWEGPGGPADDGATVNGGLAIHATAWHLTPPAGAGQPVATQPVATQPVVRDHRRTH